MKNTFVETANVRRFHSALSALDARGASEACLLVVDGEPGLGKTTTLMHWVAQNGSIYLRAKKNWKPGWFANELLDTMRVDQPHSFEKKYSKCLQELAMRQNTANMERRTFSLVIDEADHISSKSDIIETIRDISDMIELPTILVGMGKVNEHLKRFPQVQSRVSQKVKFEKLEVADVRRFMDTRCEVKVADDMVRFVHQASGGYNREVMEAMASIERFGLRYDVGEEGVTIADMAGHPLMENRHTGKKIAVPEVL